MFKGSTVRQSGLGQSSIFFQARAACQVLSMGSTDVHRRRPWPPHPFSKGSTSENFASSLSVASSKGTREESMQPERKMRDVKAREVRLLTNHLSNCDEISSIQEKRAAFNREALTK